MLLTSAVSVFAAAVEATHPFTDVPVWANAVVNTVYEKGIMTGTDSTTFDSNGVFTREQLATTLYRMSGSTETGTADDLSAVLADGAGVSKWAISAVKWAYDNKITTGIERDGKLYFDPKVTVTREQAATFIIRFIDDMGITIGTDKTADLKDLDKVSKFAKESVSRSIAAGIITGDGNGYFTPKGDTNRVSAAAMLARIPEANNGIIIPDYNKPSQDENDPNPTAIGELATGAYTLTEDFKISQAVVLDDAGPGNEYTVTDIGDHGWHETRVVRNEYGTYMVVVQDEYLLENGTYLDQYTYAIAEAKFMIVQVTDDGFKSVYEGTFPIAGNCAPNLLCGNDGMIYVVNILVDPVSYFHSDLVEYSAYLAVHEFDTKTNTIVHVGRAVVPFENPDPDAFQIDGVPKVGVMNADKQHPMIDNVNNTIHACFGAGGNFGTGYVSWFNYDITTHTWEDKNYNGEIPAGANRFEYFNLFADGKGGMFGVGCRTGTPEQLVKMYKDLYGADIKFNSNGYVWDAVYLFAIPDMHKEEVVILDRIYEPDYTNERYFPKDNGMVSPASACTYDGGCTFLASNGYFYVFYSSQQSYYYAVYDANNGFEKLRSKKLTFKNTSTGNSKYQLAIGENTNGDIYLVAVDSAKANAEIELYKIDLEQTNILVSLIKDESGKTAAIPMKIKQSSAQLKHNRLAATTTRSCSIQDNVLCILTSMDMGGNRSTTLDDELKNGQEYDAFQHSGFATTNYIFYSIELPH